MEHRRNAVGDDLTVGIDQRQIDRKIHARARHHLALESVAVHVDNARQQDQVFGVERMRRAAPTYGSRLTHKGPLGLRPVHTPSVAAADPHL